jgi:ubiquinone/menaquinone biosynthesis C-methylase UbiE
MAYRTEDACKEFDSWSRRYDRDPLQALFFRPTHRLMAQALGAAERRILDIGCGTGQFAVRIVQQNANARVCGLDLSGRMLSHARVRCRHSGEAIHLVQGDSERLPFPDDYFDAVTCAHSFHHYPRQERVAAEMHRVLRPGGLVLIADGDRDRWWGRFIFDVVVVFFEGPVRHLPSRAFRRLLRETGFEDIRQQRRRGPLPFLLTMGRAVKPPKATARAA